MIPGKTYVGILPGHTRPAFVRKRPVDAGRPPLLLSQVFGSSRRAYSVETPRKPDMFCRPRRRSSNYYYDYATAKYRPKIYVDQSPGRTITSVQQTCASCGKFRSARWQAQHPLIPGKQVTPGLCGRCRDRHTSSDEERHRRRRRCDHRHHRRCVHTDSTDDSRNSWESRRAAGRHRSCSRDYRRRSLVRSPSRDKVRIIIANQAGDQICPTREVTSSSSMEPIRVVRRTEIADLPERPPRTRSILRGTSHVEYVDSETQYIEDLDPRPPRYLHKPRRRSRVSYIEEIEQHPRYRSRPRSSSHVSYVEERPRYRSRPRSVSRVSYIEDSGIPRSRSRSRRRARSSSLVRFVDETDEQVSPSKPRRLKRRRVVYFDGPADNEKSDERTHSRTPSNRRSLQGAANDDEGQVLIEEVNTPQSLPSEQSVNQDRSAKLTEDKFIPHRRTRSQSHEASNPIPETVSDQNNRQPLETRSYAYESDHEATPRPAFRHAQVIHSPDDVEEPASHHSSDTAFEGVRSNGKFHPPSVGLRDPSSRRTFTGAETPPYRERRRRVRDSDESSASEDDDDDYPRSFPLYYRHVEAPEPPSARRTNTDLLVEMLQKATLTPPPTPGAQYEYARGRTPRRSDYYNEPITPSRSFDPSEGSEDGRARYEYGSRRMTGDPRYNGPFSTYEPECKSNAEEYNWMT